MPYFIVSFVPEPVPEPVHPSRDGLYLTGGRVGDDIGGILGGWGVPLSRPVGQWDDL